MLKELWAKVPDTTKKHIKSALILLGSYTLFAVMDSTLSALQGQPQGVKEVALLASVYVINAAKVQMQSALSDAASGLNQ